jgi:hypothetical protein
VATTVNDALKVEVEKRAKIFTIGRGSYRCYKCSRQGYIQRGCRMTKPEDMRKTRGTEKKRRLRTDRASKNSTHSSLRRWKCGNVGHVSRYCKRDRPEWR